jgi:hypothetical protein
MNRSLKITPLVCLMGLCIAWLVPASAQIYKVTDADGNVVFTDVPPPPDEQADTVELGSGNTFDIKEALPTEPAATSWSSTDEDNSDDIPDARYEMLRVVSPANDAEVRENAGNVTVSLAINPDLRPGNRLQLEMDGKVIRTTTTTRIDLTEVDRGSHVLRAHVIDDKERILISSEPSVFHLSRYSILTAPNKKPAPSPTRAPR